MGPLRAAWSFPYTGDEIIDACHKLEASLVSQLNESLDAEQQHERDLTEHREKLRVAGVRGWENAMIELDHSRYSNPTSTQRQRQGTTSKRLGEIQRWRRQIEHDVKRDPHRLFKLSVDDVVYFEL